MNRQGRTKHRIADCPSKLLHNFWQQNKTRPSMEGSDMGLTLSLRRSRSCRVETVLSVGGRALSAISTPISLPEPLAQLCLGVQRLNRRFRVRRHDLQKRARRTCRTRSMLLPVLQGAHTDTNQFRELGLADFRDLADGTNVGLC